ncbi:hypothetical protein QBC35DRAFT_453888 [Podospora australis]|uniref:Uncharacterized protein n=1 Tax=Podospora australis TaxID=1536484 RepID=A0AAN6WPP4_9PEZI|nr:hypothetical protein QBC35DRAFT_453888 [Podospora australis]
MTILLALNEASTRTDNTMQSQKNSAKAVGKQAQQPAWVCKVEEAAKNDARSQPWKGTLGDEVADRNALAYRTWNSRFKENDPVKRSSDGMTGGCNSTFAG